MRFIPAMLAASTFVFSSIAHAELISGFENGLQNWEHIGDVSVQNSSVGLAPTQGHNMVFLTTLSMHGQTTGPEIPYSGIDSPSSEMVRAYLGVETVFSAEGYPIMVGFPMVSEHLVYGKYIGNGGLDYAYSGESAAIKTQFSVSKPGYISFDWNRIGTDGDDAYFTLWSGTPGTRTNGWVFDPHTYTDGFTAVDVGLCSRTTSLAAGCGIYNAQTGWHTLKVWIDTPGTYSLGFGMNEIDEGTAPTILALDNVRFNVVPEPDSIALMGLAFVGLTLARRRKV